MASNDIDFLKNRIKEDTKAVKEAEEKSQYDEAATKIHAMYQSFIDSGFSEEQAFYLIYEMIKTAWDKP